MPDQITAPEYCLFFIQHWTTCMTKTEWSGWAQVLGGFGAVLAAFLVGNSQVRTARRLEVERRASESIHRLTVIQSLLESFEVSLFMLRESLNKYDVKEEKTFPPVFVNWGFEKNIREHAEIIRSIDPFECPSRFAVHILVQLPRTALNLAASLENYNEVCRDKSQREVEAQLPGLFNSFTLVSSLVAEGKSTCVKEIIRLTSLVSTEAV